MLSISPVGWTPPDPPVQNGFWGKAGPSVGFRVPARLPWGPSVFRVGFFQWSSSGLSLQSLRIDLTSTCGVCVLAAWVYKT